MVGFEGRSVIFLSYWLYVLKPIATMKVQGTKLRNTRQSIAMANSVARQCLIEESVHLQRGQEVKARKVSSHLAGRDRDYRNDEKQY